MRRVLVLTVLAFACGRESSQPGRHPAPASKCIKNAGDAKPGSPEPQLVAALETRGSYEGLADLMTVRPRSLDELLVALFPAIGEKPIVDRPPPPPKPYEGKIHTSFAARPIKFPVDWTANPHNDISWQLWFQSLNWLERVDDETAAFTIKDWNDHALYVDPPLKYTWDDHALALRLRAVTEFIQRYVQRPELDRSVLHAAANLVVVHLLALGSSSCYAENHNHGLMQDLALLEHLGHYSALRASTVLWDIARERAEKQVFGSVRPDGVNIENSPHYHAYFASLLLRVVAASQRRGVSKQLRELPARVLRVLAHLTQPNVTLAQFGDTSNNDRAAELANIIKTARDLEVDPAVVDELEWIATRGAKGRTPRELDAVFVEGGYAAFRTGWDPDAVVAHFRTGYWSESHYHPDETGIEIYGFGTELVVGPGIHGFDASDLYAKYQLLPSSQNVLVVEDVSSKTKPHDKSRIIAHGNDRELVWVQGKHASYESEGIQVTRTVAFSKPASFAVVDHVSSRDTHPYAQHFHLHPQLSDVRKQDGTVVARTNGTGPSVTLTPLIPAEITFARGINAGTSLFGWYFPDKYKHEPATDVVFRRAAAGGELDFPVLILVAAPGKPPPIPTKLGYVERDGKLYIQWSVDGQAMSLSTPLPR